MFAARAKGGRMTYKKVIKFGRLALLQYSKITIKENIEIRICILNNNIFVSNLMKIEKVAKMILTKNEF